MYDCDNYKIVISRNVRFHEEVFPGLPNTTKDQDDRLLIPLDHQFTSNIINDSTSRKVVDSQLVSTIQNLDSPSQQSNFASSQSLLNTDDSKVPTPPEVKSPSVTAPPEVNSPSVTAPSMSTSPNNNSKSGSATDQTIQKDSSASPTMLHIRLWMLLRIHHQMMVTHYSSAKFLSNQVPKN